MQMLPDRVDDFVSYYKPDRIRKELNSENYTISDYLKGISYKNRFTDEYIADPKCAISAFEQQNNILESTKARFESTIFDIQSLVQADLFDNELDAAADLNKHGYQRGAGAIAGVVLEGHLGTVCENHKISTPKNATISKLYELLKNADVIDIPTWRSIQHLSDLRNLCDHKKDADPSADQMSELIEGTRKITKILF